MRVWYSLYELQPRTKLGAKADAMPRRGALLRVENEHGQLGYGDVFPWTELGDAPLAEQLQSLASPKPARLAARSLALANHDAEARARGLSLFAGLEVPESHLLLTNLLDEAVIQAAMLRQAPRIKVKVGAKLADEHLAIVRLLNQVPTDTKLRLDFNENLSAQTAEAFFRHKLLPIAARIDFVEDPCPYDACEWKQLQATGIPLAIDRKVDSANASEGFSVVVVKPAIQDAALCVYQAVNAGHRVVLTSYLDHPIGQLHAAWQAARARSQYGRRVDTAGLLSQVAYQESVWTERVFKADGTIAPSDEPGIGYGAQLEKEAWKRLV